MLLGSHYLCNRLINNFYFYKYYSIKRPNQFFLCPEVLSYLVSSDHMGISEPKMSVFVQSAESLRHSVLPSFKAILFFVINKHNFEL